MTEPLLPDCRMRFPAAPIDFVNEVGVTGQAHDNYPAPGQQPRYDWMRMALIALLANQASYEEPTQYREGTWWFDLNTLTMKIWQNGQWAPAASALLVDVDQQGNPVTLAQAYATIKTLLGYRPTATFGGQCIHANVQLIPIPATLLAAAGADSQPLVWVNGKLLDPRLTQFSGSPASSVQLTGPAALQVGDTFTVLMLSISPALFFTDEVVV